MALVAAAAPLTIDIDLEWVVEAVIAAGYLISLAIFARAAARVPAEVPMRRSLRSGSMIMWPRGPAIALVLLISTVWAGLLAWMAWLGDLGFGWPVGGLLFFALLQPLNAALAVHRFSGPLRRPGRNPKP